jgi:hypothetical protein
MGTADTAVILGTVTQVWVTLILRPAILPTGMAEGGAVTLTLGTMMAGSIADGAGRAIPSVMERFITVVLR